MKVTVAFLHADSQALDDHWMNKAARMQARSLDGAGLTPYIHCELLFPETDGSSYSITANSQKIHKVPSKQFARDEWEFLDLHLPENTVYNMQLFANQKHAQQCGFNWLGFSSAGVWPVSGGGKKYFCSEFVCEALQQGGLLTGVRPASMTPARLYAAIRPLPQTIHSVHPKVLGNNSDFRFNF